MNFARFLVGLSIALVGVFLFAAVSHAEDVHNGKPDLVDGWPSDFDWPAQQADVFVVSQDGRFGWVRFYGSYGPPAPEPISRTNVPPVADDFTLRFFAVVEGVPNTEPEVEILLGDIGRADTGRDIVAGGGTVFYDVYVYQTDFSLVALEPGEYLLSVVNDTPGVASEWYWSTSSQEGVSWSRNEDQDVWEPTEIDQRSLSFVLSEVEPLGLIFEDTFESGNLAWWSQAVMP